VVFIAFPDTILLPFIGTHANAEMTSIHDQVIVLLRFVAFYTFFDGMAIVFAYAIRGAGDTRFPFVYTLVTSWTVMVFPTYFLISTHRGGLNSAWCACSAYICLVGTGFFLRFLRGNWKKMNIIGNIAAPPAATEGETAHEPSPQSVRVPLGATLESD